MRQIILVVVCIATAIVLKILGYINWGAFSILIIAPVLYLGLQETLWVVTVKNWIDKLQTERSYILSLEKRLKDIGSFFFGTLILLPAAWYLIIDIFFAGSKNKLELFLLPLKSIFLVPGELLLPAIVPISKPLFEVSIAQTVPASQGTLWVILICSTIGLFSFLFKIWKWDNRVRIIREPDGFLDNFFNGVFRLVFIYLSLPALFLFATYSLGMWEKTYMKVGKNAAAEEIYEKVMDAVNRSSLPLPQDKSIAKAPESVPEAYDNTTRQTPAPTYTPSSSRSKSSKSGGVGGWLVWIVVLVALAGLIIWLKKKGKLSGLKMPAVRFKMPSFRFGRRKKGSEGSTTAATQEEAIAAAQRLEYPAGLDPAAIVADIVTIEAFLNANRDSLGESAGILDRIVANARPYVQGGVAPISQGVGTDISAMQAVVTRLQNALRGGANAAQVVADIAFVEANAIHFQEHAPMLANLVASVREKYQSV